ncbi:hypothetical protein CDAR_467611 [Caerostris darwini]|uniref:Uncharacterized protein n=1 Tax=Caerostris darwini TaxID=1538125 RepID=A0AAV4SRN0_9ARAC|nr:hypothetical protein CDAR_467611 [Caerostris darwini]
MESILNLSMTFRNKTFFVKTHIYITSMVPGAKNESTLFFCSGISWKRLNLLPYLEKSGHLVHIISSFESPNEILRTSEDELPEDGVTVTSSSIVDVPFGMI